MSRKIKSIILIVLCLLMAIPVTAMGDMITIDDNSLSEVVDDESEFVSSSPIDGEVGEREEITIGIDTKEESIGEEAITKTEVNTKIYYATIHSKKAKVYTQQSDNTILCQARKGDVFLVIDEEEKRLKVAFCVSNKVYEGFVSRNHLTAMDEKAVAQYYDKAIYAEGVVLYCDNPDWPLIPNGDGFKDSLVEMNANFISYDNDTVFYIHVKEIQASLVANQNNCWTYANSIYKIIWGTNFASDFAGSADAGWNMLRTSSDEERRLTAENLKNFVNAAELGSTIRITTCVPSCAQFGNDGLSCGHRGHNLIIVGKDNDGFTVIDNHKANGSNYSVTTRYYPWQGFINYWGSYTYVKYIKWPNAPVYSLEPTTPASGFRFKDVTYPKVFKIDNVNGWDLKGGTLESNYSLQTITTKIVKNDGSVISSDTISISGYSYSIKRLDTYSGTDNGVRFSYIKDEGDYKWILIATDSANRSLTLEMQFTAVSIGTTETATAGAEWSAELEYSTLRSESCMYTIKKSVTSRKKPFDSSEPSTEFKEGDVVQSAEVIKNCYNNIWIKTTEGQYIYAGYHLEDDGSMKETGNQYLSLREDKTNIRWENDNLENATLAYGQSYALKGTIAANCTMNTIQAEFHKNNSCWGNPTDEVRIYKSSYDMYASELDYALKFGSLPEGNDYKLVIIIKYTYDRGLKNNTITIEKSFSVGTSESEPTLVSISDCKITGIEKQIYTGKGIKILPTIQYNNKLLTRNADYSLSYENNKNIGVATIIITGKGNYTGSIRKTFIINPKAVSLKSLTAGKGSLTVKWSKGIGGVGYEVQYSIWKNFLKRTTLATSKTGSTKAILKDLSSGKTYYVRIRAYKKVGTKKYYSTWSKVKSKKVK